MNRLTIAWLLPALLFVPAAAAFAQTDLAIERALLSQEVRDYSLVKQRRTKLIRELKELWSRHEGAPARGGSEATISSMARHENEIQEKEAELLDLLRRGHELRRAISERSLKIRTLDRTGSIPYAGRWTFVFEGTKGTIEATQTGVFLSGYYELPSLSSGTFIGYGGKARISLTLIGNRGDLFATLQGHPESSTLVRGTYLRGDLASGTPAEGNWSMEIPKPSD